MAKLSDKQKKEILADLAVGATIRSLAIKHGVSRTTIQRVKNGNMDEVKQRIKEKHEENTQSVLEHMEKQKDYVCSLVDTFLHALADPEKIRSASLAQIATSLGIVLDKYTRNEVTPISDQAENNLFEAIKAASRDMDLGAIPELAGQTKPHDDPED